MKKLSFLLMISILAILLAGCASVEPIDPCLQGKSYGFFWGVLHGLIAPISLLVSFFDKETVMYAQNNSGSWYGLGFLIGSGGWGILASNSSKRGK